MTKSGIGLERSEDADAHGVRRLVTLRPYASAAALEDADKLQTEQRIPPWMLHGQGRHLAVGAEWCAPASTIDERRGEHLAIDRAVLFQAAQELFVAHVG